MPGAGIEDEDVVASVAWHSTPSLQLFSSPNGSKHTASASDAPVSPLSRSSNAKANCDSAPACAPTPPSLPTSIPPLVVTRRQTRRNRWTQRPCRLDSDVACATTAEALSDEFDPLPSLSSCE
eukprot:CAMPEP_0205937948 /NCGR_PEP_ID=MMETSP1325-20131115/45508_1 /ASSEMBLY_ACC=CAM_ASM_000708 /TAXON_ID=236786 /ORGANISM="Florenciella sp., Strain RCC1007" /LENGTH=122 /DNA_ID=CAMNT_0053308253 /DNA_START=79 /DNA_END=447 /DNA_ORIENTATION=-